MKNTRMTNLLGFASFIVLIALNISAVSSAMEFKVGGVEGWRVPDQNNTDMYTQWATKNRFQIGDSLSFESKNDSVLVVDKFGYYHCNTSKHTITAFNNNASAVVIKLDKPGPFYFISGTPDHCKNGQRLLVDVMTLHPAKSPPSIGVPPEPYYSGGMSPAPSPLSSSSLVISVSIVSALMAALVSTIVVLMF